MTQDIKKLIKQQRQACNWPDPNSKHTEAMIKIGEKKYWFICNKTEKEDTHSIFNIGWASSLAKKYKDFSGFKKSMFLIQIIIGNGRLKVGTIRRVQLIEKVA